MALTAFSVPRLRQALCRTIRSLSSRSLIKASMMYSSERPVLPREMAATALTLGSGSENSCSKASTTAGFWNAAVCVHRKFIPQDAKCLLLLPYSTLISRNLNFADIQLSTKFSLNKFRGSGLVWARARGHWKSLLNNFRGSRCIREN